MCLLDIDSNMQGKTNSINVCCCQGITGKTRGFN
jgi:hypothetical protein